MTTTKKIGIWMDHSNAVLIEYTSDPADTKTIESTLTHRGNEGSGSSSENLKHNKEQNQQAHYYKNLGEIIKGYGRVVLFGPTEAKTELLNALSSDHHFDSIKIETRQTDKMTENQQHAFVREYFTHH